MNPQTIQNKFGQDEKFRKEMGTNIKRHQSLLSEHKNRTKQPQQKINYANAAINFYDRNIIKKKPGRPRLETNSEILSV